MRSRDRDEADEQHLAIVAPCEMMADLAAKPALAAIVVAVEPVAAAATCLDKYHERHDERSDFNSSGKTRKGGNAQIRVQQLQVKRLLRQ